MLRKITRHVRVIFTASENSYVIGPSVFRLTCALQASHLATQQQPNISGAGDRSEGVLQKPEQTLQPWQPQRTRASPKLRPNPLSFSSVAWLGTYARSGALCCMGLNWMSDWWEIIDECCHPLSAARAIDQDQHTDFVCCAWVFLAHSASSVVNAVAGPEKAW